MKYTLDLYKASLKSYEIYLERLIRNQMTKASDWRKDGVIIVDEGFVPTHIAGVLYAPGLLYFNEDSKYYKSKKAMEFAFSVLEFFERNLSPEGLMDFYMCNFRSAPDTSFSIQPLVDLYNIIKDKKTDETGELLKKRLYGFIVKMADGVFEGGFHTPNHRWVVTSALSMVMNMTGDKKYLKRINEYLAEGIDCDEEGEYSERSSGGYNFVNNEAILIIAQELDKPELLEFVRRNLMMMTYYIHTDFLIFTQNSTRQDKGKENIYLDKYLYQYLKAGYLLKDEQLLGVAKAIQNELFSKRRGYPIGLDTMMAEPEVLIIPEHIKPFEIQPYVKHFKKSNIVRVYHNGMTLSVIEDRETFLYLKYKSFDMFIQGGILFFNERHIKVNNIRPIENGFAMDYHGQGIYYHPFGQYQGTADFWEMDKSKRATSELLTVDAVILVTLTEKGFRISLKARGIEKVSVRLDIAINNNAFIMGDGYTIKANAGGILLPESGAVRAEFGTCGVKIGPVRNDTYITQGLFGSEPLDTDKYHIFFNYLTPFEHSFTIEPVTKFED